MREVTQLTFCFDLKAKLSHKLAPCMLLLVDIANATSTQYPTTNTFNSRFFHHGSISHVVLAFFFFYFCAFV